MRALRESVFWLLLMAAGLGALWLAPSRLQPVPVQYTDQPDVIVECYDPSLTVYAAMWRDEVGRRFHNAVLIAAHGGGTMEGLWVSQGSTRPAEYLITTRKLVEQVQERYPHRTLVLMACNPQHLKLGIPGVYYASGSVWCVPDRALTPDLMTSGIARLTWDFQFWPEPPHPICSRAQEQPDNIGNIWEFIHD